MSSYGTSIATLEGVAFNFVQPSALIFGAFMGFMWAVQDGEFATMAALLVAFFLAWAILAGFGPLLLSNSAGNGGGYWTTERLMTLGIHVALWLNLAFSTVATWWTTNKTSKVIRRLRS